MFALQKITQCNSVLKFIKKKF